MTRVVDKGSRRLVYIEPEPDTACELCGTVAELRPYGPNGERVCFPCGMKDRAAAERAFARVLGVEQH
jgi:hypothetical protein